MSETDPEQARQEQGGRGGALLPGLYVVATPIGAARDITLRALDVIAGADILAAEDTRALRRLMQIHGIAPAGRPILAYHDHNGPAVRPRLLAALAEGRSVACLSEAGTPLVSDPGHDLVRAAIAAGVPVFAAPGPSAVLAALAVAGLPTDRFLFAGFLPSTRSARRRTLAELAGVPATLVFFESPHRIAASLDDMAETLGPERPAALCRELTKRHEEVRRASLASLAVQAQTDPPRGEIVVVVGAGAEKTAGTGEVRELLDSLLETESIRDAAALVAQSCNLPRREAYRLALERAALRRRDEG